MLKYDCVAIGVVGQTATLINNIISAGLDGFETDIRITSDGVFILRHDSAINGVAIATSTYAECFEADAETLTLAQGLAIQKENNLVATYESKIADAPYAHDIVDAIVASGVDLSKTYIEPTDFSGTSYYTGYNKNINVVWKGGELSAEGLADAAQYLTGSNKVLFTINSTLLESMSDEWVHEFENAGLGLVADPVTAGLVTTYAQYPFDQIWGTSVMYWRLKDMRDTYRDDPPVVTQGIYGKDGNELESVYGANSGVLSHAYAMDGSVLF